ncbi:MAG: hypothetical protein J6X10_08125 [Bacteroidales bacterium]|nr:hypothetical protein [Bacteroidales bacterium]
MLKFFKHNYIAQLIVIVLLLVALWIPVFISHVSEVAVGTPTTPLYNLIAGIFGSSSLAMTIFAFIIFSVSVLFFNSMLSVNQLVTRNSSIGAFVFVLCMCCVPIQDEFYPFMLACPFIMMAMQTVYLIYQVEKPEAYLMNAGLFVALASMFYFPAIILIIWVLLSILIMDVRGVRLSMIPVLGLMFPYFILFVIFYFNQTFIDNIHNYSLVFNELSLEKLGIGTSEMIVFALLFVFLILSLMMIKSGNADNSVSTRKKVNVTILLFVFSFIMLFMKKPVMCNGLIFLVLSVFISMALCYVKKSKLIDIVLIIMMLAVIANQYLPLFGIKL